MVNGCWFCVEFVYVFCFLLEFLMICLLLLYILYGLLMIVFNFGLVGECLVDLVVMLLCLCVIVMVLVYWLIC